MCTNPIKITVNGEEVTVKCGKCITCRREKAQEWAIKLINESKYHTKACFITLTFDNTILLDKNSKAYKYGANPGFVFNINNSKEYFKKFIKRLRKKYSDKYISYFHVGEYGEKTKRPHHHAIIFGINFEENRKECEVSKTGHIQYSSDILTELWACGRCTIQDINSNNTIYIAQYSIKKFKSNEEKRYRSVMSFSNRCKMNIKWARKHYKEIEKGYINDVDGKKYRIPKSYLENFKNSKEEKYRKAYRKYEENMLEHIGDISTSELIKRQKNKEEILKQRMFNFNKKRDF